MLIVKPLLFLLVILMPVQLMASNINFLKYSVITDFTQEDIELLQKEYVKVLNGNKPGEVRNWLNQETKNGGEITVIKQYMVNALRCKRLMFKNKSKHQAATTYYNFCLIEKEWKVVN